MRAGTCDQDAAGLNHLQCTQVHFLVAAQRSRERPLRLGEGGRIEDNGTEPAPGIGPVAQKIECVCFDPVDFRNDKRTSIDIEIALSNLERWTRSIYPDHLFAHAGKMERKCALVAEDVQRSTASIPFRSSIIFALIEKCSSLLSGARVVLKPQWPGIAVRIHFDHGARLFSANQPA